MSNSHKRNLSSSYYDSNSFTSIASQDTLTECPTNRTDENDSEHISRQRTIENISEETTEPVMPPPIAAIRSSGESRVPYKSTLWRANTLNMRSPKAAPGLEHLMSSKSTNYFLEKRISNNTSRFRYNTNLTRNSSIATAISMRRADIMVSRDNPQHLHQHRISGVRNDDEETAVMSQAESNNNLNHLSLHAVEPEDELSFEKKKSTIILLGRLLLKCGCPCHRVDDILQHSAKFLSLDASFSFLPDSFMITFTNADDSQSIMVKSPQGYDNGKIVKINDIMNSFFKDEIDIDRCLVLLHDVATAPPTCGTYGTLLFFTLSSFTASAMMFGGTWIDAGISALLGFIVANLFLLSSKFPIYAKVFEISTSVFVAIFTRALHRYCCFLSVAMPALLILLPGYTMTVGVNELSARHVTTGIVRLVYATFYAFQLAYGLQIGSSVYRAINPDAPLEGLCHQTLVSPWFYIILLPVMSTSIALSYGSSKRQWLSQGLSAGIAFCFSYFLGKVIPDDQIVGGISAFAIGLYSNFALKVTGEPPLAPLSVGVTLLVPGSLGVKGAFAALQHSNVTQANFAMQMLTSALGLSAGLFASSMIVYPSGKKRSMYISL